MTRVDFYLLSDADPAARARFACRLAHRAWREGMGVLVHTPDADAASALDELMWTFPEDAFLPHGIVGDPAAHQAPVAIGCGDDVDGVHDLLINLADDVPMYFGRFARLAEVVIQDAHARERSRARYRFYRDRGYPLQHHDL